MHKEAGEEEQHAGERSRAGHIGASTIGVEQSTRSEEAPNTSEDVAGSAPAEIVDEVEARAKEVVPAKGGNVPDRIDAALKTLALITLVVSAVAGYIATKNGVRELYSFNVVAAGLILAQGFIGAARFAASRWRWPLITTIASLIILLMSLLL